MPNCIDILIVAICVSQIDLVPFIVFPTAGTQSATMKKKRMMFHPLFSSVRLPCYYSAGVSAGASVA